MHRKADADPSAGFDALAAAQGKVIPPPLAADSVNGVHSDASASARECTVRVIPATPTADALYRPLTHTVTMRVPRHPPTQLRLRTAKGTACSAVRREVRCAS